MQTVPRLIKNFIPNHYTLSLDISESKQRKFSGTVDIIGEVTDEAKFISLHAKDLTIETALIDGQTAEFSLGEFDELRLSQDGLSAGDHLVTIGFSGEITDAMHGMYPCYFQHEGVKKELIATQFESHHAREVFPCIDEPEAKATFDVILTTEDENTVLGNMPIKQQRQEDSKLVTVFETSPRMSSYLLAWVVGEMQHKTAKTAGGVEVNVWATPAQPADSLDFALDHAVKTIEFFNDYFGVEYPLPKSDHVALPDFSSGAMENWGLITYRESVLLADPKHSSIDRKQYVALVISHELSHQWFGNLVTMKWWNNLWLNESFATIMEYIAVDAIHPEWNAWLDFASSEAVAALRRDAIDGVQPVQVDVNHPDEISSLFDSAIVYAKGARLMRMCQNYIGEQAFRKGLASYFNEFAYQNTEAEDLWKHLSAASGKDISKLMNTWISQSGYPVVTVDEDSISQEQFFIGDHQPSDKLWPIPLNSEGNNLPELLENKTASCSLTKGQRLNAGDTAHFIAQYSPKHLDSLLSKTDSNELDRLQLLHEQTLLIRSGRMPSAKIIDLLEAYKNETSNHVWDIMSLAFSELKKFVETDEDSEQKLRKFAGDLARPLYKKLGWQPIEDESENDVKLRSTILGLMIYSQDAEVLDQVDQIFAKGIDNIDPEIKPLIIGSVVYRSRDQKLIEKLMEDYRETSSPDLQSDIRGGITNVRQPEHIDYIIENLTNTDYIRPQDNSLWFVFLMRNRHARNSAWQWMRDNWDWIDQQFGGDKSYDYYPRYAASGLVTVAQRNEYQEFFESKRDIPALTRVIDLGLSEINARVELLNSDSTAVRERLNQL